MRKKIEFQWEILDESTQRVKVIGGWLVSRAYLNSKNPSMGMCFISDRDHEWHIQAPLQAPKPTSNDVKASDFDSPKA